MVEADRTRPGVAEHVAAMPAVTVLELGLPAAIARDSSTHAIAARVLTHLIARFAPDQMGPLRDPAWAQAHTRYAAEPTPERPGGAVIATAASDRWKGQPVRILDLEP